MTRVTAIMVSYGNEDAAVERLQRDLLPALHLLSGSEIIVVDNSETRSERLAEAVFDSWGQYCWQDGRNLMYGPGINAAVRLARNPYLVYVCANHGHSRDPTWILDLLAPLLADSRVAMTGCLQAAGSPEAMGFPAGLPELHVQGGVFAARTDVLRRYPYSTGAYAHYGSDIFECFQLMQAGWRLTDVPTVRSVWRTTAGSGPWKYVHQE